MAHRTKLLTSMGSAQAAFAEPSKVTLSCMAYISVCSTVKRLIELFHLCDDQLFISSIMQAFSVKVSRNDLFTCFVITVENLFYDVKVTIVSVKFCIYVLQNNYEAQV